MGFSSQQNFPLLSKPNCRLCQLEPRRGQGDAVAQCAETLKRGFQNTHVLCNRFLRTKVLFQPLYD